MRRGTEMDVRHRVTALSLALVLLTGCSGGATDSAASDGPTGTTGEGPTTASTEAEFAGAQMRVGPPCDDVELSLVEEVLGRPPEVDEFKPGDDKIPGPSKDKAEGYECFLHTGRAEPHAFITLRVTKAGPAAYRDELAGHRRISSQVDEGVLMGPQSFVSRRLASKRPTVTHVALLGSALFFCHTFPAEGMSEEEVEALATGICGGVARAMSTEAS